MNVAFINPFLESMLNVLTTMAALEVKAGRAALKEDSVARGDVTGLIGMTGEQARGSLAISFTEPVILEVTTRILGEPVKEIDDTVIDMVGEITNIVTGGAKKLLAEKGYHFDMAIPAVVAGTGHVIDHKARGAKILIPFTIAAGDFFVEVCFEDARKG